jgi:OFA family oxalate/formate antiporter-like MFS transporter
MTHAPTLQNRRWLYLATAVLTLMCTGSIYAFSVFSGPLAAARGWTVAQVTLAFTINTAVCPIPMILAGKFVDRGYARASMMAGGCLFGLAFLIIGYLPSLGALYLGYGVLGGVGISLAYAGALGNVTRYFPDKRGLATGLVTAGNGAAALITAPLAASLIASGGVVSAVRILGCGFFAVALVCGLATRSAPPGFRPAGWTPPVTGASVDASLDWRAMVAAPVFYLLLALLAAGATSGLMVAANASQIGQNMFHISAAAAAACVGLYAASNAMGRFLWGAVSDRIGGANTLIVIFVLVAAMLGLLASTGSVNGFVVGMCGIGLAFGGVMGVFPSIVAARFGVKYFGENYGIMFCGYALAAFIGPRLGASMAAANGGDFTRAFELAILVCVGGLALALLLRRVTRRTPVSVQAA